MWFTSYWVTQAYKEVFFFAFFPLHSIFSRLIYIYKGSRSLLKNQAEHF